MSEYKDVPVEVAKQISSRYGKDIVIICCWDYRHGKLHTTTYGDSAANKVYAAKGGEIAAAALDMDLSQMTEYEDFRKDFDAGKQRAMEEAIRKHLPSLKKMAAQIIHPTDNTFAKMAADLEAATAEPPQQTK